MMRMVHCETSEEYEELWREYTKLLNAEPFVPERYQVEDNHEHTMTPELTILMAKKGMDVKAALMKVECNGRTAEDEDEGTLRDDNVKDHTEDAYLLGKDAE